MDRDFGPGIVAGPKQVKVTFPWPLDLTTPRLGVILVGLVSVLSVLGGMKGVFRRQREPCGMPVGNRTGKISEPAIPVDIFGVSL